MVLFTQLGRKPQFPMITSPVPCGAHKSPKLDRSGKNGDKGIAPSTHVALHVRLRGVCEQSKRSPRTFRICTTSSLSSALLIAANDRLRSWLKPTAVTPKRTPKGILVS